MLCNGVKSTRRAKHGRAGRCGSCFGGAGGCSGGGRVSRADKHMWSHGQKLKCGSCRICLWRRPVDVVAAEASPIETLLHDGQRLWSRSGQPMAKAPSRYFGLPSRYCTCEASLWQGPALGPASFTATWPRIEGCPQCVRGE